jgi:hypothetical protein
MLFAMPLGPMPGLKAEVPVPPAPVHPMNLWKPVEGNSQVQINGLGQMRTCLPEPEFVAVDTAMMLADEPRNPVLEKFVQGMVGIQGTGMIGFASTVGSPLTPVNCPCDQCTLRRFYAG